MLAELVVTVERARCPIVKHFPICLSFDVYIVSALAGPRWMRHPDCTLLWLPIPKSQRRIISLARKNNLSWPIVMQGTFNNHPRILGVVTVLHSTIYVDVTDPRLLFIVRLTDRHASTTCVCSRPVWTLSLCHRMLSSTMTWSRSRIKMQSSGHWSILRTSSFPRTLISMQSTTIPRPVGTASKVHLVLFFDLLK